MRGALPLALLAAALMAGCVIQARPPGFVQPLLPEEPLAVEAETPGTPTDAAWVVLAEGTLRGRLEPGDAWRGVRVGCAPSPGFTEKNGTVRFEVPGLNETTHAIYASSIEVEDPGHGGRCRVGAVRYYGQDAPGERQYLLPRSIPYRLTFEADRTVILEDGTRIPEGGQAEMPWSFTREAQDAEGGRHRISYEGTLKVRNLGLLDKDLLQAATGKDPTPAAQAAAPAEGNEKPPEPTKDSAPKQDAGKGGTDGKPDAPAPAEGEADAEPRSEPPKDEGEGEGPGKGDGKDGKEDNERGNATGQPPAEPLKPT